MNTFAIRSWSAAFLFWVLASLATAAEPIDVVNCSPAELVRHVRQQQNWVYDVESFLLRVELVETSTPKATEEAEKELRERFPDIENFDPNRWSQLRPKMKGEIELAFDRRRIRRRVALENSSTTLEVWNADERRLTALESWRINGFDPRHRFLFDVEPGDLVGHGLFAWLSWPRVGMSESQLGSNPTPEKRKEFQLTSGPPEEFVDHGIRVYRGRKCRLISRFASRDRWYVDIETGLLAALKEGITRGGMDPAILAVLRESHPEIQTVERARKFVRSHSEKEKQTIRQQAWNHAIEDIVPVFEHILTDYDEVAPGRVLPMSQMLIFYDLYRSNGKELPYLENTRTIRVVEARVDTHLPKELFRVELIEGAEVYDKTHDPPLSYKVDPDRTPEEWAAIVAKANKRKERDAEEKRKLDALIGQPAPPLDAADWLNSEPLSWNALKGKVVVLDFWSIGCGPCRGSLASMSGLHAGENQRIAVIGVHTATANVDGVREFLAKWNLTHPILIDRGDGWGDLFRRCAVRRMPYAILVGGDGKIVAHGNPIEMGIKATELAHE